MLPRLSQAIAITFLLYLIMGMGKLTAVQSSPEAATPQQPIGLKILPKPTLNRMKSSL